MVALASRTLSTELSALVWPAALTDWMQTNPAPAVQANLKVTPVL